MNQVPKSLRERLTQSHQRVRSQKEKSRLRRGIWRTLAGYTVAGLADVLDEFVHAVPPGSVTPLVGGEALAYYQKNHAKLNQRPDLHAAIGEALRIHVRDNLLNQPYKRREIDRLINLSLTAFDHAIEQLKDKSNSQLLPWVLAHRGAVYTMRYWLQLPLYPLASKEADSMAHLRLLADSLRKEEPNLAHGLTAAQLDSYIGQVLEALEGSKLESAGANPMNEGFLCAQQDFTSAISAYEALRLGSSDTTTRSRIDWTQRFLAFLHALRGQPASPASAKSDFELASELLRAVAARDVANQSSLQRSIGMLLSYDAVCRSTGPDAAQVRPAAASAARSSLEACLAASEQDPEDFVSSYFGAVSTWVLSGTDDAADYRDDVDAAIQCAQVRSQNAISQASATMLGLHVLQAMRALEANKDQARTLAQNAARKLIERLADPEDPSLDLESQAMFLRDPVWYTLYNEPRYETIRRDLEPSFQALRARFKISE